MKKVKVYNISKLIENENPDKRVFGFLNDGIAIIEGTNGVFAFDYEGVGWEEATINATIPIGLTDIPEEHHFFTMPQYRMDAQLKELMEAECKEMLLTEFIDRYQYNDRLQRNFATVLQVIDNIGLNSKEYYQYK